MLVPLLACAPTLSVPDEAARLRAGVQPIDAPIALAYGPHPAWQTRASMHLDTSISSRDQDLGSSAYVAIDTEWTGTDTVSRENGMLRDDGEIEGASVNGKPLSCEVGALVRIDASYTSQGAPIADNSRATCHAADRIFAMLGGGLHRPALYVEATNWSLPAGGVATGTVIHKAPGHDVGFDRGDLGARILGRAVWHDQPVIVAELVGCGTATPAPINDTLTLSPMHLCPNGVMLLSATSGWILGVYEWFDTNVDGMVGKAPIKLDISSQIRQESR